MRFKFIEYGRNRKNALENMAEANAALLNRKIDLEQYKKEVEASIGLLRFKTISKSANIKRPYSRKDVEALSKIISNLSFRAFEDEEFKNKILYYVGTITNFDKNPKKGMRFMNQKAKITAIENLNKILQVMVIGIENGNNIKMKNAVEGVRNKTLEAYTTLKEKAEEKANKQMTSTVNIFIGTTIMSGLYLLADVLSGGTPKGIMFDIYVAVTFIEAMRFGYFSKYHPRRLERKKDLFKPLIF